MRERLQPLPTDAPAGTLVLVVEDDRTITLARTRSEPWELPFRRRARDPQWVVQLARRTGGYALQRCFLLPESVARELADAEV